jgi:mRNA-degrading endonuclease RelE of RelBE toxin-antitoxin system
VSNHQPSAPYELTWENEAIDRLATLVKQYPEAAQGVIPAIYGLAANPRPTGSTQLGGSGTYRRLLLGYFRVLYAVTDNPPLVRIILVGRADQPR